MFSAGEQAKYLKRRDAANMIINLYKLWYRCTMIDVFHDLNEVDIVEDRSFLITFHKCFPNTKITHRKPLWLTPSTPLLLSKPIQYPSDAKAD